MMEEKSRNGRVTEVKCWQLIKPYNETTNTEELANEDEDDDDEEGTVGMCIIFTAYE